MRIEARVWSLDYRMADLPRRTRIARRREVRENLVAAAHDIGAVEALRNLGSAHRLAAEYVAAEFGTDPRPHWNLAVVVILTSNVILTSWLREASLAFRDGVLAADPSPVGTYRWSGVDHLQSEVTWSFADGASSSTGGAWTPLAWLLFVIAAVLCGRLWRALPWVRRRRRSPTREMAH
jgi:hypothetical protein